MKRTNLKVAETPKTKTWEECMNGAGRELAHAAMHPKTPAAIKSALQSFIVNTISNESGYEWCNDEEALAFLLPRYLNHMNEDYARGLIHAAFEIVYSASPEEVEQDAGREARSNG